MSTLLEIEAATEALTSAHKARLVRQGDDVLLEAPSGAPSMTTENVKRMLEDWP